jgi:signal transduction histidine kinase
VSSTAKHTWPLHDDELRPALRVITSLAHADMGMLLLHDAVDGRLTPVLGHGMSRTQFEQFGSFQAAEGAFGTALTEHRLVRVRNALDAEEALRETARRLGFRNVEILPFFRADGSALGAFAIIYRHGGGSRRHAARMARDCADLLAVAFAHANEHVEAEDARARIAGAAQAKVQFFARMSHELRTPLQSISGYINLLTTTTGLSDEQQRMLTRIAAAERILVHIIDDLILFSRLETGHMQYHFTSVSANETIRTTEAVVSPLALAQKVLLVNETVEGDLCVNADSDKLLQILVNLAANAIKFSRGGDTVTLTCRADGENVLFDVQDTGRGIPPDKLSIIFDPYVQLDTGHVAEAMGWGLGLAISREFTAAMQGTLSVKSEVGKGSVFTLRLPRAAPLAAQMAPSRQLAPT